MAGHCCDVLNSQQPVRKVWNRKSKYKTYKTFQSGMRQSYAVLFSPFLKTIYTVSLNSEASFWGKKSPNAMANDTT